MNAPYRDVPISDDNEPTPDLSVDLNLWREVLIYVAFIAAWTLLATRDDVELATVLVILALPGLIVLVLLAALYQPAGRWLAARRARAVVEGVAALEAKVASARE